MHDKSLPSLNYLYDIHFIYKQQLDGKEIAIWKSIKARKSWISCHAFMAHAMRSAKIQPYRGLVKTVSN